MNSSKLKKLYSIGKTHLVDTTAVLASTNPIFALFENVFLGMSDDVSLNARLFASGISYLGMGSAISRGRDLSRKLFKIKDTTSEKIQTIHDAGCLMAFNAGVAPIMYTAAGATPQETLYGTLTAMGLSTVIGPVIGYSIDLGRDLTGIKESKRIPKNISNLSSKVKKGLAVFLTAGLIGLNGLVYKMTPDQTKSNYPQNNLERVVLREEPGEK